MDKQFVKQFEEKVGKTIKDYKLINKKDKVIVACSGGKDSTTVLYLLNKLGYNVEGMMIDLMMGEWSEKNMENVEKFCRKNDITLHIVDIMEEFGSSICYIRAEIQSKTNFRNCLICGVIKRWLLNKKARELGGNKLATGHNLDDEVETVMMNMFHGNQKLLLGLGPKTGLVKDKKFVQRIKPLFFLTNKEIKKYSQAMGFPVIYEPCPCAVDASRGVIRKEIAVMEKQKPDIKNNIMESFLKIQDMLRKNHKTEHALRYCDNCGEPSRNEICKTCKLMKVLNIEIKNKVSI